MTDEINPFDKGPLDEHQVTDIEAQLAESIRVLPDADVEKILNDMEAAIKQKRSMGQLKQALQVALTVAKPFLGI